MVYQRLSPLLALLLAALMLVPAVAQDDPTTTPESETLPPLLMALSVVPDTPEVRTSPIIATFADYRASYALRGVEPAGAYADMDNEALSAVFNSLSTTGVTSLAAYFAVLGEMPALTGFDFFEIDYALEFAQPPDMGAIIGGTFNLDTIVAAHEGRGYTVEASDEAGLILLCGAEGCESGAQMNFDNRNPANPFGGALGQSHPLAASGSLILSSPNFDQLTAMQSAQAGDVPSLAEDDVVQAIANLLYSRPTVGAVVLMDPLSLSIASPDITPEQIEALPALPSYGIVAVAYTADDTYEYSEILLTYASAEEAEGAVIALTERLAPDGVVSSVTGAPLREMLDESGELVIEAVSDEATGLYAARISIRVSIETADDLGRYAMGFNRWMSAIVRRDTLFLLPTADQ
ncbi:MAG: hypothetical protein MUF38_11570 [Anaerolineae bacterium]|jgi:hypothetical protein|nr:hypothetical protein [Anaerolineae bacterium]